MVRLEVSLLSQEFLVDLFCQTCVCVCPKKKKVLHLSERKKNVQISAFPKRVLLALIKENRCSTNVALGHERIAKFNAQAFPEPDRLLDSCFYNSCSTDFRGTGPSEGPVHFSRCFVFWVRKCSKLFRRQSWSQKTQETPHTKATCSFFSGWCFQPLWKIWKSIGMIIPNIWENKKMFQTTNQFLLLRLSLPLSLYLSPPPSLFLAYLFYVVLSFSLFFSLCHSLSLYLALSFSFSLSFLPLPLCLFLSFSSSFSYWTFNSKTWGAKGKAINMPNYTHYKYYQYYKYLQVLQVHRQKTSLI